MDSIEAAPAAAEDNWPELVKAFDTSGQSAASFCREHQLNYDKFRYWCLKLGRAKPVKRRQRRRKSQAFVAVESKPVPSYKIIMPQGVMIECQQLPDPAWLSEILTRSASC